MNRAVAGWWGVRGRRLRARPGHPFAAAVALRARELARRPVVLAAFSLQATALAGTELLAAVGGDGLAGAGDDLVLGGLRLTVAPGGLVFGVLVAAVVGAEFAWAAERALLARDPRRLRFAGYQLAVAASATRCRLTGRPRPAPRERGRWSPRRRPAPGWGSGAGRTGRPRRRPGPGR